MARNDWVYQNLEKDLMAEVGEVVEKTMEHGTKKYKDNKDFIVRAIKSQLDAEQKEEVCKC